MTSKQLQDLEDGKDEIIEDSEWVGDKDGDFRIYTCIKCKRNYCGCFVVHIYNKISQQMIGSKCKICYGLCRIIELFYRSIFKHQDMESSIIGLIRIYAFAESVMEFKYLIDNFSAILELHGSSNDSTISCVKDKEMSDGFSNLEKDTDTDYSPGWSTATDTA